MRRFLTVTICALLATTLTFEGAAAEGSRKRQREPRGEKAAPPPPPDKRDRLVNAPGTPFHGRPYWQALAQCGGIYFKLNTLYANAAIHAKVVKPDPPANARFSKQSNTARRTATIFFEATERILMADRSVTREQAAVAYDARANDEGERQKTAEAAESAAKPCPQLYQTCREAFAKMCPEPQVSAAVTQRLPD
jgi:hypothetical protein